MNSNDYIKKYDKYGYFKIENFFNNLEISKIIDEINNSKDVDIFKDNNNVIRRIERIYNKGEYLKRVNLQFKKLILKYLNLNVLLFKDKFNLKPPGGEGFYAHYDGIFYFTDNKNIKKRGWYEYGNNFINILLAIDDCNEENGTLELARSNDKSFEELIKNTKQDGTQELLETIENKLVFEKINLKSGDLVVFKNTCAHRSSVNYSKKNRRILYYTYLTEEFGDQYNNYFEDKKLSKNITSKSISQKK